MRKRARFIVILLVLGMCFVFLYPTLRWYFWTGKEEKALALASREKIRDYAENMARSDVDKLIESALSTPNEKVDPKFKPIVDKAKSNRRFLKMEMPAEWTYREVVKSFPVKKKDDIIPILHPIMERGYRDSILTTKDYQANAVKLGLDLSGGMSIIIKADLDAVSVKEGGQASSKDDAMKLAMETLTSRIDKFGLSEPVIRQQGEDRIYIEMPGAADADRMNSIIMGRGILAFHIVDDEATEKFKEYYRNNPGKTFDAEYNLLDPSIIPEDTVVMGVYHKDEYGIDQRDTREPFLVVKKEPGLEGKYLVSVDTSTDATSKPVVIFTLDSEGAKIFGDLTTANEKKRLAIVSDNKIKEAPTIREPILGGRGSISGFSTQEAENLKTILRTAWLSVPLQLENQQVIGANLGEEAIAQGKTALLWGLLAVLIFMVLYYKEAGINACIAQVLNLYIMFSILSAFNLTLTLPSIAGMILTIGMAVDANVVIFERIKEELRAGKGRKAALDAGFDRAFWAIMDSNITTFIAALFLSILGTGPIKGFAYSLSIGVISSVFTALFVSRLIFDFGTETLGRKTIGISWRKLA